MRDGVPPDGVFDETTHARYGTVAYKVALANRRGALGCLVATDALSSESAWTEIVDRYGAPQLDGGPHT